MARDPTSTALADFYSHALTTVAPMDSIDPIVWLVGEGSGPGV